MAALGLGKFCKGKSNCGSARGATDLGSLGGKESGTDISVALGVNSKDYVVGYTCLPTIGEMPVQQVAFLFCGAKIPEALGKWSTSTACSTRRERTTP